MTHWPADYPGPFERGDTQEGRPGVTFNGEVSGYGFEYINPAPWAVEYRELMAKEFSRRIEEAMKDSPLMQALRGVNTHKHV